MAVNGFPTDGFDQAMRAQQPVGRPAAASAPGNFQSGFEQPNPSKLQFKKAVKYGAKGRVALIGPGGSGKSFTMLKLARALAGPTGKIACIDTEHGSLSKYAHTPACSPNCADPTHFDFDVLELDSFTPDNFLDALTAAEEAGYAVFGCDSLSHFWVGKDGALEFVDMASKRQKDQMGGWKDFRPHERAMVDRMTASPCHVICTMRTKNDYQEITDERGKKKRVKIGLAPVQREGLDYEFDLVGYMDEDNTFIVDKTRCSAYAQKAITKPGAAEFAPFIEWLSGTPAPQKPAPLPKPWTTRGQMVAVFESLKLQLGPEVYYQVLDKYNVQEAPQFISSDIAAMAYQELCAIPRGTPEPISTGGHPVGTQAAADFVAQQKIEQLRGQNPPPPPNPPAPPAAVPEPEIPPMRNMAQVKAAFASIREQLGETRYQEELQLAGVSDPGRFRSVAEAQECYKRLAKIALLQKKEAA